MKLLVIDDDPGIATIVESLVDRSAVEVASAATAAEGWAALERSPVDVLVLDNRLPDAKGLDLLTRSRQLDPRLPTLFVTAEGSSIAAIEAMKRGAFDYLSKPIDLDRLERQIVAALEHRRLMRTPVELAPEGTSSDDEADSLIGRCPAMQEVFRSVGRLARQDVPVLLVGETGVGKELVARAIYQHGDRAGRLFLKVTCSDFSEERLEIELFGEEGTSGDDHDSPRRVGKLEQCDGGTLLLEEIAALPLSTQSKLLRVLRQGLYERVGGTTSLKTDIRLTFTTTHDRADLLRSGRLREDLFYALSAYELCIPPLRDRGDDLRLLTERFVAKFGSFGRSLVGSLPRVSPDAYQLLSEYDWPGNVSELQAVLRRALIESKGAVLASDFLRHLVSSRPAKPEPTIERASESRPAITEIEKPAFAGPATTDWRRFVEGRLREGSEAVYDEAIEEMERHVVSIVLTHTGGNQAKAAKVLGMTRTSLRKKVLALGIRLGPYLASSGENE